MINYAKTLQRASMRSAFGWGPLSVRATSKLQSSSLLLTLPYAQKSTCAQDFQRAVAPKNPDKFIGESTLGRGHFANQLDDYGVSQLDASFDYEALALSKTVDLNDIDLNQVHPLEYAAELQRQQADVFAKLKLNQVLLTNLPTDVEGATPFGSRDEVSKYLKLKVHHDLEVQNVNYVQAIPQPEQADRTAYIVVTVGSKRQAYMVSKALRKTWFGDRLLKVKLSEDAKKEAVNNRTIVVRGFPTHFNARQLLKTFFDEEAGALVGLELPIEHAALADWTAKNDASAKQVLSEKADQFDSAQKIVSNALERGLDLPSALTGQEDADIANRLKLEQSQNEVSNERMDSVLRAITRLQSEGTQVLQSKQELLQILNNIEPRSNLSASIEIPESELKEALSKNQAKLQEIVDYLRQNSEAVEEFDGKPIENMLELGQGELAHAYDTLLQALDSREALIQKRLEDALKHFGLEERILWEGKNFDKELEDIASSFELPGRVKTEQIISIQQQIRDVVENKGISGEEKFTMIMTNTLNPFRTYNFGPDQLHFARGPHIDRFKYIELVDYRQSRYDARRFREGSKWLPVAKESVEKLVDQIRGRFDLPFDELYHKERSVVQAVIKAEADLQAKLDTLDSPLSHSVVGTAQASKVIKDSVLKNELIPSSKPTAKKLAREQLQDESAGPTQSYDFVQKDLNDLQWKVEQGLMSQSEMERVLQNTRDREMRNLGYAFVTFSHSDEARLFLIKNQGQFLGYVPIEFDLKAKVSHGDMDFQYFIQRAKNDAKMIDEIGSLREAKAEFRQFEKDLDQVLPKREKLMQFREMAKNLIENNKNHVRSHFTPRSPHEEKQLTQKMRDFQAKYPNIDMTQLFETEQAELARKALHKRAFASYKAYEFLKAGLTKSGEKPTHKDDVSDAKRRLKENDPYDFPELDQSVARVLSKDIMVPELLDMGEQINVPGRRFKGYTDQEFLESYYGKDMMRVGVYEKKQDALFMPQASLKHRHPLSQYLKSPAVDERIERFQKLGLAPNYKSVKGLNVYPGDPELMGQFDKHMFDELDGQGFKDMKHPDDPSRSLLGDLENMVQRYGDHRAKRGLENTLDGKAMRSQITQIYEEYRPPQPPRENFMDYMRQGKFMPRPETPEVESVEGATATPTANEGEDQKFESEYGSGLSPHQKEANKEYLYELQKGRFRNFNEQEQQMARESGKSVEELVKEHGAYSKLPGASASYGGKWYQSHEEGVMREKEHQEKEPEWRSGQQSLRHFVEGSEDKKTKKLDDDMDVFDRYQQNLRREAEHGPRAEASIPHVDAGTHQPEMPRLQEFYEQEARNQHPFERITNRVNDSIEDAITGEQTAEDLQRERELYHRELMGRLMGRKLEPRQFEQLMGRFRDDSAKLHIVRDNQEHKFMEDRALIALFEEKVESLRRQKVREGEWTEGESHQQMQAALTEYQQEAPGPNEMRRARRDQRELMSALAIFETPEQLFEREYHFDETLGQSLAEHVAELKQKLPGARIFTRRDRDGFAVVKTTFEPEFKYNLDVIESWEQEDALVRTRSVIEALTKTARNQEGHSEPRGPLTQEDLAGEVRKILTADGPFDKMSHPELDAWSLLQMSQLAKGVVEGKINQETALEKFEEICSQADFAESQGGPLSRVARGQESSVSAAVEAMQADSDRFNTEIQTQLMRRARKQLFHTKRKDTDFVRPRQNEKELFAQQTAQTEDSLLNLLRQEALHNKAGDPSNQNQEQPAEQPEVDQEPSDDTGVEEDVESPTQMRQLFGDYEATQLKARQTAENHGKLLAREDYDKLKEQIRAAKERKERLLSQGLPEFQPYLRL